MKTAKLRPNFELRDAIFKTGLSQVKFAKKVGIDPALISHYVTGKRRPTVIHRNKLAAALRKPVARLFAAFRPRRKVKTMGERVRIAAVRMAVFDREAGQCRCCVSREPQSMHELLPRSLGGLVSTANSIAVCNTCHGYVQRHEILVEDLCGLEGPLSALRPLKFTPRTDAARDWLSGGAVSGGQNLGEMTAWNATEPQ